MPLPSAPVNRRQVLFIHSQHLSQAEMSSPQVRVGVGVFILESTKVSADPKNPRFLIGKRKASKPRIKSITSSF